MLKECFVGVNETTASSNWLDLSKIRQFSLRRIELNMFCLDCILGAHVNVARSHLDMCVVVGVRCKPLFNPLFICLFLH